MTNSKPVIPRREELLGPLADRVDRLVEICLYEINKKMTGVLKCGPFIVERFEPIHDDDLAELVSRFNAAGWAVDVKKGVQISVGNVTDEGTRITMY